MQLKYFTFHQTWRSLECLIVYDYMWIVIKLGIAYIQMKIKSRYMFIPIVSHGLPAQSSGGFSVKLMKTNDYWNISQEKDNVRECDVVGLE